MIWARRYMSAAFGSSRVELSVSGSRPSPERQAFHRTVISLVLQYDPRAIALAPAASENRPARFRIVSNGCESERPDDPRRQDGHAVRRPTLRSGQPFNGACSHKAARCSRTGAWCTTSSVRGQETVRVQEAVGLLQAARGRCPATRPSRRPRTPVTR